MGTDSMNLFPFLVKNYVLGHNDLKLVPVLSLQNIQTLLLDLLELVLHLDYDFLDLSVVRL